MKFEDLTFLFNCDKTNRGWCRMDFDEAACVYRNLRQLSARDVMHLTGVEIGRAKGGSTILIASAISGKLISIDNKPVNDDALIVALQNKNINNVTLIIGNSEEVEIDTMLNHIGQSSIDFVFIDGNHSYRAAKKDFDIYSAIVRKGGIVMFHDMVKSRRNAENDIRLERLYDEITDSMLYNEIDKAGSVVVFEKK